MKCNWTKRAMLEYKKVIKYVYDEYGLYSAQKFISSVEYLDSNLAKHPETGSPELLLANRAKYFYRSHTVGNHNKLIYIISKNGIVTIVDMWDMRRDPNRLANRIKSK